MATPTLLVTVSADSDRRRVIEEASTSAVEVRYVDDIEPSRRGEAVESAAALLSFKPHQELSDAAFDRLHSDQVLQSISAGVDQIPLDRLPDGLIVQSNAGAHADPIAEHVCAMYLALCKRLRLRHERLQSGEFDQFQPNRRVEGTTCTIFGFGAIGQAVARQLKAVGVTILGINRHGEADEPVSFLGTPADLQTALGRSDGLVLTAPLTPETRGRVDREMLRSLPADGLVINVARGQLIDQEDLYRHLEANPEFHAGIDAWWTEPARQGRFELDYPFLELPNVIGSPHNAAQVPGLRDHVFEQAVGRVTTAVTSGDYSNVVDRDLGY